MKKPLSATQFINLGKTLFDAENELRNIIDELTTLDFIIQSNESEELILQYEHDTAFIQAEKYYNCLVSFPVKRCSRNAVGSDKYFYALSLVFGCVPSAYRLAYSSDLITKYYSENVLSESRKAIETALDFIIELKQKNGIN